ncbi:MAG TPA: sigma-70 family RNA polymerase sigma factor [Arthrobacter sp.]|jgi:RNA polymerase sigma-70 factor (ECF subfamily)
MQDHDNTTSGGIVLSERELAFIALYKDSYPRIHKYVLRRVDDAELAQELAADVFRVAWQKWDGADSTEIPWLLTVARNLIGNAYRGRDRQKALHDKLMVCSADSGEDSDNTSVEDAMMALREKDRDILQLAYWDELSIHEISQVLHCTQSSAKVRLHRAREAFRKLVPALSGPFEQKVGA